LQEVAGKTTGSVSWCTNVGNEWGKVLTTVLTESERLDSLDPVAIGLIQRLMYSLLELCNAFIICPSDHRYKKAGQCFVH